jgi:hypothetical protein
VIVDLLLLSVQGEYDLVGWLAAEARLAAPTLRRGGSGAGQII